MARQDYAPDPSQPKVDWKRLEDRSKGTLILTWALRIVPIAILLGLWFFSPSFRLFVQLLWTRPSPPGRVIWASFGRVLETPARGGLPTERVPMNEEIDRTKPPVFTLADGQAVVVGRTSENLLVGAEASPQVYPLTDLQERGARVTRLTTYRDGYCLVTRLPGQAEPSSLVLLPGKPGQWLPNKEVLGRPDGSSVERTGNSWRVVDADGTERSLSTAGRVDSWDYSFRHGLLAVQDHRRVKVVDASGRERLLPLPWLYRVLEVATPEHAPEVWVILQRPFGFGFCVAAYDARGEFLGLRLSSRERIAGPFFVLTEGSSS